MKINNLSNPIAYSKGQERIKNQTNNSVFVNSNHQKAKSFIGQTQLAVNNKISFGISEKKKTEIAERIIDNASIKAGLTTAGVDYAGVPYVDSPINSYIVDDMVTKLKRVRGSNTQRTFDNATGIGVEMIDTIASQGVDKIIDKNSAAYIVGKECAKNMVPEGVKEFSSQMGKEILGCTFKEAMGEAYKLVPFVGPAVHGVVKTAIVNGIGWDTYEKLGGKRPVVEESQSTPKPYVELDTSDQFWTPLAGDGSQWSDYIL